MRNGKVVEDKRKGGMAALSKAYLVLYNGVQTIGWSYILYLTARHLLTKRSPVGLFQICGLNLQIYQSLAILEILHCIFGLVPSSPVVTGVQVFSRVFQVWGIISPVENVHNSPTLAITLLAWGITEVVRYSYYLTNLLGTTPKFLTWCRYTFFFALYPAGVTGEIGNTLYALETIKKMQLFHLSLPNPLNVSFNFYYANILLMLTYVPLFPQMFLHMVHQRKKVLGHMLAKKLS